MQTILSTILSALPLRRISVASFVLVSGLSACPDPFVPPGPPLSIRDFAPRSRCREETANECLDPTCDSLTDG